MTDGGPNRQAHMRLLAERVAEQLRGSCLSKFSLGDEVEDAFDDITFCNRLDELVFQCTICHWWWEQSEMAEDCGDDWVCQECSEGELLGE